MKTKQQLIFDKQVEIINDKIIDLYFPGSVRLRQINDNCLFDRSHENCLNELILHVKRANELIENLKPLLDQITTK